MAITGLMAAPLSDGRLQVWASKNDGTLWTLWKEGTDPDSAWAQWRRMEAPSIGVQVGCAAPLPNNALQLFVIANAGFNPPFQSGRGVQTTWKVSQQSTAAWADWQGFWNGEQALHGGAGASSLAAAPLTDGRIQVFIAVVGNNVSRLVTLWKATTDVNAAWTDPVDFNLPAGQRIFRIAAGRLSDGRIQLFATTDTDVLTTWKETTNPNAQWSPWRTFYSTTDDDAITAAPLSDGRLQLWRLDRNGAMWSRWKLTTNPNAAWSEWSVFPAPGGHPIAFTAAPLSDRRLQLWAADSTGAIFSSWKVNAHPDAAWTPWSPFPQP
jgi:hypothetical protein